MTDTEATTPGGEATPEQKANRHATRALARALSRLEQGTPEEQKARWSEGKANYTTQARKLIRALTKDGLSFQLDENDTIKARRSAKLAKKAGAASEA